MTMVFFKRIQVVLTLVSLFIVSASYYFEYLKGLQPCPLCLMQRFSALLLVVIAFLGIFFRKVTRAKRFLILQGGVALLGLFFALRQVWLQTFAAGQGTTCMPELQILVRYFPLKDILHALFWGSGECAEVHWSWLNLSMPTWAALYFLSILILSFALRHGLKAVNEKS